MGAVKCYLNEALAGVVADNLSCTSLMAAITMVRAQVRPWAASRGFLRVSPPVEIAPLAEKE